MSALPINSLLVGTLFLAPDVFWNGANSLEGIYLFDARMTECVGFANVYLYCRGIIDFSCLSLRSFSDKRWRVQIDVDRSSDINDFFTHAFGDDFVGDSFKSKHALVVEMTQTKRKRLNTFDPSATYAVIYGEKPLDGTGSVTLYAQSIHEHLAYEPVCLEDLGRPDYYTMDTLSSYGGSHGDAESLDIKDNLSVGSPICQYDSDNSIDQDHEENIDFPHANYSEFRLEQDEYFLLNNEGVAHTGSESSPYEVFENQRKQTEEMMNRFTPVPIKEEEMSMPDDERLYNQICDDIAYENKLHERNVIEEARLAKEERRQFRRSNIKSVNSTLKEAMKPVPSPKPYDRRPSPSTSSSRPKSNERHPSPSSSKKPSSAPKRADKTPAKKNQNDNISVANNLDNSSSIINQEEVLPSRKESSASLPSTMSVPQSLSHATQGSSSKSGVKAAAADPSYARKKEFIKKIIQSEMNKCGPNVYSNTFFQQVYADVRYTYRHVINEDRDLDEKKLRCIVQMHIDFLLNMDSVVQL